jgi:hypothetical protein
MTQYFIVLIIGICTGYLLGSAGTRYQRTDEIQRLIDIDARQRKADGAYRVGDDFTEYQRHVCGAGRSREVAR